MREKERNENNEKERKGEETKITLGDVFELSQKPELLKVGHQRGKQPFLPSQSIIHPPFYVTC